MGENLRALGKAAWLVLSAVGAVAIVLLAYQGEWLWAWLGNPDPSQQQRIEGFKNALVAIHDKGVTARQERGGMSFLGVSDVVEVEPSRCDRELTCARRGRFGCHDVQARFYCAYSIRESDGNTAMAIVRLYIKPGEGIGVDDVPFNKAEDKLCKLGFGCRPGSSERPDAHSKPSARQDAGPSSPQPGATPCKGIRAEVAGKGETCLDPGDPTRREFQDCNGGFCGPIMVALPQGRGVRGYSAADMTRLRRDRPPATPRWSMPEISGRSRPESEQREITIGYQFAVGKFEVTFEAWDECVADGGCSHRPFELMSKRGARRPVLHVSWMDITKEFLPWLNRKLGLSEATAYRLPTEAEWEYAARAGTTTIYAFGDIISTAQARFYADATVEVGSFAPNGFGLYDMHGNVAEWVQDCFSGSYDHAPVDGSAYLRGDCDRRVVRGGGYLSLPRLLHSAGRSSASPDVRGETGFRVARTLVNR